MVGVLKSPCASSHTTATWLCRRWSPAIAPRPTVQSPDRRHGGAAEFAAGALGERQGEALLLLELCVEALQPGASGGPDEGCVEEPVAVEHGRDVAAAEGVLDLIGQLREPAVHGRVAGMCHTG